MRKKQITDGFDVSYDISTRLTSKIEQDEIRNPVQVKSDLLK